MFDKDMFNYIPSRRKRFSARMPMPGQMHCYEINKAAIR